MTSTQNTHRQRRLPALVTTATIVAVLLWFMSSETGVTRIVSSLLAWIATVAAMYVGLWLSNR